MHVEYLFRLKTIRFLGRSGAVGGSGTSAGGATCSAPLSAARSPGRGRVGPIRGPDGSAGAGPWSAEVSESGGGTAAADVEPILDLP